MAPNARSQNPEIHTKTRKARLMTATAVLLDARSETQADDPFALDVRVIEDARPAEQTACATNNGCAPTCASSCASTP